MWDGNNFPSICVQFFTSQNWNYQFGIKIKQKICLSLSKLLSSLMLLPDTWCKGPMFRKTWEESESEKVKAENAASAMLIGIQVPAIQMPSR